MSGLQCDLYSVWQNEFLDIEGYVELSPFVGDSCRGLRLPGERRIHCQRSIGMSPHHSCKAFGLALIKYSSHVFVPVC